MDLIASRRYQPDAEEPAKIDCIMMPVSELPVSAGLGAFLDISRAKIRGCWKSFELKRWEEFSWIRSSVFRI